MKTYKMEVGDYRTNPYLFNPVRCAKRTEKFGVLEAIEITHAVDTANGLWLMGTGENGKYSQYRLDEILVSHAYELKRLNELLAHLKINIEVKDAGNF